MKFESFTSKLECTHTHITRNVLNYVQLNSLKLSTIQSYSSKKREKTYNINKGKKCTGKGTCQKQFSGFTLTV